MAVDVVKARLNEREQLVILAAAAVSAAFGLLSGAAGETDSCLN